MMTILTIAAAGSAGTHIAAEYRGPRRLVYICKPLTMLLIIALAINTGALGSTYGRLILTGLAFSLGGDIFLMLPRDRFIPGLVSFLVAHVAYIAAISVPHGLGLNAGAGMIYLVYAVLLLGILNPGLGKMRLPVLLYAAVLALMGALAASWFTATGAYPALLATIGAMLFVISDSLLALNRFRQPFKSAQLLILTTYYLSQWLFASSISG